MIPVTVKKVHPPVSTISSVSHRIERPVEQDRTPFQHFQNPKKRKTVHDHRRNVWMIILLAVACIVIIFIAITYVYAKAVVIITPKTEQVAVSGTYSAVKSGSAGAGTPAGALSYEVIQTSETASTTIVASQGPLIQNKAWGLVTLYTTYSTSSQKLLAGTRLVNDKGLIYTTAEAITIPGIHKTPTSKNPNATSTGSVSVYVVAAEAGSQYDITPADLTGDFKIVAFQGTPKYTEIYGRLKANTSIVGGYSGYQEVVATSTLESTSLSLSQSVTSALKSDLKALVPTGYVLYDGAYDISMASSTVSDVSSTTNSIPTSAVLTLQGSLYGIMFKESDLAKAIAPAQVAEFPPGNFVINNLESLKFVSANPVQSSGSISFTLSGSFGLVGTFPSDTLAQELTGVSVAQSKDIFAKYSTIISAHAIITPFWKHSFPDSLNKIIIDIQQ
jgi:hypothetical protein